MLHPCSNNALPMLYTCSTHALHMLYTCSTHALIMLTIHSIFTNTDCLRIYSFIIGIGGETTALTASKLGKKVAVVEQKNVFGGPSGLTSKAFRLAANTIYSLCSSETNIRLTLSLDYLLTHSCLLAYLCVKSIRKSKIKELWAKMFPALKAEAQVLQAADSRKRFDGSLHLTNPLLLTLLTHACRQ